LSSPQSARGCKTIRSDHLPFVYRKAVFEASTSKRWFDLCESLNMDFRIVGGGVIV
jgi:hypothetical protein